ncbi:MAG TPA: immunity 17 family protein [Candidatus Fimivivens faecavium]|nr:immunity 17 family protein [Candidatus Fimivivens faecavium]
MNGEQITAFLQEHWNLVSLAVGVVVLIGAILNWNWLCDPAGAPHSHRYGRGSRRVIFFLMGVVLIVVGIWGFVLALK